MPHFALAFIILTIHNMVDITSFHLREDVEFFMNYIGVIGAGRCDIATGQLAREVGREIALSGSVLVCGGLGGVMEEACRGCREAGGIALGISPGLDRNDANPYVSFALAYGNGRNAKFSRSTLQRYTYCHSGRVWNLIGNSYCSESRQTRNSPATLL